MEQKKSALPLLAQVPLQTYISRPIPSTRSCARCAQCATFPGKAEQLIQSNGLTAAKAYKDYKEAIASGCIDAVSICLPPQMHADIAVEALHSDCHVICEKPMACSLEECDAMIAAAKESGKVLSVVVQNRCKTPNQR